MGGAASGATQDHAEFFILENARKAVTTASKKIDNIFEMLTDPDQQNAALLQKQLEVHTTNHAIATKALAIALEGIELRQSKEAPTFKLVDYTCNVNFSSFGAQDFEKFDFLGKISLIPMPSVLLEVKLLSANACTGICKLGTGYCKISDNVAGLLAWDRIAKSEDGMHSRDDHFIAIVKILSNTTVIRNTSAFSGSKKQRRPDGCILAQNVSVVRFEEKADESELLQAQTELKRKMSKWMQRYGTIPYIIGIAIAGDKITVHKIDSHLVMTQILELNMGDFSERIKAVRVAVHLGHLVSHFKTLVEPSHMPLHQKIPRYDSAGYVELCATFVAKQYQSAAVRDCVVNILNAVAKAEIPNTIRICEHPEKTKRPSKGLYLAPRGQQRSPRNHAEMANVIVVILHVLIRLHRIGFCHCDLRWPNVVFVDNEPFVIDFEYARTIGSQGPSGLKTVDPRMQNGEWDAAADSYQVLSMIEESALSNEAERNLIDGMLRVKERIGPAALLGELVKLKGDWLSAHTTYQSNIGGPGRKKADEDKTE